MEWWIYLVYPFLLLINRQIIYLSYLLKAITSIILYFLNFNRQYFWSETLLYLPTWCIGPYVADVLSERIKWFKILNIFIVLLPISIFLQGKYNNFISDFMFGIGLLPVFVFLLAESNSNCKNILNKFVGYFRWVSPFSYTLYIIHFPIQSFIVSIYMRYYQQKLPHNFYLAFIGILVSFFVAYASHFFIEKKVVQKANKFS